MRSKTALGMLKNRPRADENRRRGLTERPVSVKIQLYGPRFPGKLPREVMCLKLEDHREDDPFQGTEEVASFTECTGLMPALPRDDAADASSASLYAIHGTKGARRRTFKRK